MSRLNRRPAHRGPPTVVFDGPERILISGAARGVGLACAKALARCGARLFLVDRDRVAVQHVAERLGAAWKACDAVCDADIDSLAEDLATRFPVVDMLINTAGRGYIRSLAMMRVSQAVLPLMRHHGRTGTIFNIASVGGFTRADGLFPYASSLVAFQRLSDALAKQTANSAVSVIRFTPRTTATDSGSAKPYRLHRMEEQDTVAQVIAYVAGGRGSFNVSCRRLGGTSLAATG